MEPEGLSTGQNSVEEQLTQTAQSSICSTPEEQGRLLKLFQLFIEIDNNLQQKSNENKRNSDSTDKTE